MNALADAAALLRIEPRLGYLTLMIATMAVVAIAVTAWNLLREMRRVRRQRELLTIEPDFRQAPSAEPSGLIKAMGHPILTALLLAAFAFLFVILLPQLSASRLPGNQQGYEPQQPIHFSHRLHAGELEINCQYCHSAATRSRHAGLPSASTCMNCHRFVTATLGAVRAEDEAAKKEKRSIRRIVSPELMKLYGSLGLGDDLKPAHDPKPLAWIKVHNVPDFVYFDHRPHVNAGVACQTCHGPVETMERVRQVSDLSMGWCVNCHRDPAKSGISLQPRPGMQKASASIDCASCHF